MGLSPYSSIVFGHACKSRMCKNLKLSLVLYAQSSLSQAQMLRDQSSQPDVRQQGVSPGIDTQVHVPCPSLCPHLCLPLHSQRQGGSESSASLAFSKIHACTCSFVGLYTMVCMFGLAKSRGATQLSFSGVWWQAVLHPLYPGLPAVQWDVAA